MPDKPQYIRRLFKIGSSSAVTIPIDLLDHIHASTGDYIYFHKSAADWLSLRKATPPPEAINPDLFDADAGPESPEDSEANTPSASN